MKLHSKHIICIVLTLAAGGVIFATRFGSPGKPTQKYLPGFSVRNVELKSSLDGLKLVTGIVIPPSNTEAKVVSVTILEYDGTGSIDSRALSGNIEISGGQEKRFTVPVKANCEGFSFGGVVARDE